MQITSRSEKAVVIGAGFGGLAAAIRLQALGVPTTLLEKWDKPGGRAYVFQDNGFTFDAGPTVVTAPDALAELFAVAGRNMADYIEMLPITPMYRLLWEDGSTFDYHQNEEQIVAEISKFSPADAKRYPDFFAYTEKVFAEGYLRLGHVPFPTFWDMIRVAPQLVKLKAYRSVFSRVADYFQDPHIQQAFSFNSLLIGGHPFRASAIYSLIHPLERAWGVWYPKGGMNQLVDALARLFVDIGGEMRLNAPVDRIQVEGNKVQGVTLANAETIACARVISNADVTHTYNHFLRDSPAARSTARSLNRKRYSPSLFVLHFGTDKKFPHLKHHTVLFANRYKQLLDDIFDKGVLADDFSLYLHAPCRSDPSLAPEGCESFYVLAPVPHLGKANIDWPSVGPRYAEKILAYLEEQLMPGLGASLVTRRIFTPEDFKERLHAPFGSAFSLEPTLTQSAYFRAHNRDRNIEGLYIVGAGAHPGAGIPGVIGSAKATVGMIEAERSASRQPRTAPLSTQANSYV